MSEADLYFASLLMFDGCDFGRPASNLDVQNHLPDLVSPQLHEISSEASGKQFGEACQVRQQ